MNNKNENNTNYKYKLNILISLCLILLIIICILIAFILFDKRLNQSNEEVKDFIDNISLDVTLKLIEIFSLNLTILFGVIKEILMSFILINSVFVSNINFKSLK